MITFVTVKLIIDADFVISGSLKNKNDPNNLRIQSYVLTKYSWQILRSGKNPDEVCLLQWHQLANLMSAFYIKIKQIYIYIYIYIYMSEGVLTKRVSGLVEMTTANLLTVGQPLLGPQYVYLDFCW